MKIRILIGSVVWLDSYQFNQSIVYSYAVYSIIKGLGNYSKRGLLGTGGVLSGQKSIQGYSSIQLWMTISTLNTYHLYIFVRYNWHVSIIKLRFNKYE